MNREPGIKTYIKCCLIEFSLRLISAVQILLFSIKLFILLHQASLSKTLNNLGLPGNEAPDKTFSQI